MVCRVEHLFAAKSLSLEWKTVAQEFTGMIFFKIAGIFQSHFQDVVRFGKEVARAGSCKSKHLNIKTDPILASKWENWKNMVCFFHQKACKGYIFM